MAEGYDITLKKEVLIEVAADVYAQCYRYEQDHGLTDEKHPVSVMRRTIAQTQHGIVTLKTDEELERARGQFDFARACLKALEGT